MISKFIRKILQIIGWQSASALLTGSAIIVTITMMSYYNFKLIQDQVIQREEKQMLTIAKAISDDLEGFLVHHTLDLILIGTSRAFQDELKSFEKSGVASFPTLEHYSLLQKEQIELIAYFSLEGTPIFVTPMMNNSEIHLTAQGLGQIYLGKASVVGSVYEENERFYINLLQPVWTDEVKKGFLLIKLNLNSIYKTVVESVKVGERGYVSVKDSRGMVIMHPNNDIIGKNPLEIAAGKYPYEDWSELQQLYMLQQRKEYGVGIYNTLWMTDSDAGKKLKINAFSPVTLGQDFWVVEVYMDYEEATGYLQQRASTIFILNVTILLVFGFLTLYIYRIKRDEREYQKEAYYLRTVESLNEDLEADIVKLRRLETELTKSKEKYENIFNASSDGMIVVHLSESGLPSRIFEVNNQMCNLLGFSREEFLNMDYSKIISEEALQMLINDMQLLKERKAIFFEARLKKADFGMIPVEISARLMDEGLLIMSSRDITGRLAQEEALKRSELRFRAIVNKVVNGVTKTTDGDIYEGAQRRDKENNFDDRKNRTALELEKINIKLEEMFKKELDEKKKNEALMIYQSRLAAMGEMIGNIAHQWRQPLGGLGMIFSNIRDMHLDSTSSENDIIEAIERGEGLVQRMSKTIDDFRYFFEPKANPSYFLVSQAIDMTMEFMKDLFRLYSIDVIIKCKEDALIFGHMNQLSQVLQAILQNAQEAIKSNSSVEKVVEIIIDKNVKMIIVDIIDTGGGVKDEFLDKLFDSGFTTKSGEKGSGIGLYLSKVIIEKNFNGKIYAYNRQRGLCIRLELPIENLMNK